MAKTNRLTLLSAHHDLGLPFVNLATASLREGTDIRRARLYKVQLIFVAYGSVVDEGIIFINRNEEEWALAHSDEWRFPLGRVDFCNSAEPVCGWGGWVGLSKDFRE